MKKKIIWLSVLIILIATYLVYLKPSLNIPTAYTAKYVCSSVFIADAEKERLTTDLNFFPINKVKYSIDRDAKSVSASLMGMYTRKAYYYELNQNCGCTLDKDLDNASTHNILKEELSDSRSFPNDRAQLNPSWNIDRLTSSLQKIVDDNPATLAIVVANRDTIIAEAYGNQVSPNRRILGWSMTKSMSNALIGTLVQENKLNLNSTDLIPLWRSDERNEINLNNLLQMNSGLKFSENYFLLSDVTRMLYLEDDFSEYAADKKMEYPTQEKWHYSSGTSNILSAIIRDASREENYHLYPRKALFDKIGMHSALIEYDGAQNFVMSSYGWATARDWTRFGMLYLNDGIWKNEKLLPEDWVKYSTTPANNSEGQYGSQIWLNENGLIQTLPRDAYFENGFGGQRVTIIPSKDLVITVLSGMQMGFDFDALYTTIFKELSD